MCLPLNTTAKLDLFCFKVVVALSQRHHVFGLVKGPVKPLPEIKIINEEYFDTFLHDPLRMRKLFAQSVLDSGLFRFARQALQFAYLVLFRAIGEVSNSDAGVSPETAAKDFFVNGYCIEGGLLLEALESVDNNNKELGVAGGFLNSGD